MLTDWTTLDKVMINKKAREVTGVNDILKMSRLLRGWVEKDLLEKIGRAKKDSYYRKPGQEIPRGLFSRGVDNKTGKSSFSS